MEKRPNIKNVADLAGVSISTVSRVLNRSASVSPELEEKVFKAIEDTGYSINPIASTLKSTRRNQIAIVIPSLRQTYYTDIIKGISDYCYKKGILSVVFESSGDPIKERAIIKDSQNQWLDGIIFAPSKDKTQTEYKKFASSLSALSKSREEIPVVLIDSEGLNDELNCVRVDYEKAFSQITSHLIKQGRNKIAYLCGSRSASMFKLSLAGVKSALQFENLILKESYIKESGFTVLDGYRVMLDLLNTGTDIDGVVCANDQMAAGVLRACQEQNIRVPEDIAIVGFGGVALSIVTTPPITTMIVPRYDLGYRAATLLFDQIERKKKEPKTILLEASLAVRGSTLKTASTTMDIMFGE